MDSAFLKQLQLNLDSTNEKLSAPPQADVIEIHPKPEFCLKTRTVNGAKVFINICTSDKISPPRLLPDAELSRIIQDPDSQAPYRLPMSIGDLHTETDRVGGGCVACDVVVHHSLIERMKTSTMYHHFFISLAMQGVQQKHAMDEFSEQYVVLKNKLYLGSMPQHFIRSTSRPAIIDLSEPSTTPLVEESKDDTSKVYAPLAEKPNFKIVQVPPRGHPDFLVAEFQLPKLRTSRGVDLDIGEDRIVLATRSNTYALDVFLPFNMLPEQTRAEFNRKTRVLTVTLPVVPCGG